ncbi:MAG: hypothetical protein AAF667_07845 [Pseudomonadota bacterium]
MTRMIVLLFIALLIGPAHAHVGGHPLTRLILVEATDEGTLVTLQVPAPLVYAAAADARGGPDAPIDAPFLTTIPGRFGPRYVVEAEAISQNPVAAFRLLQAVAPLKGGAVPQIVSARAFAFGGRGEMLVGDAMIEGVLLYPKQVDLTLFPMVEPPKLPLGWYMETHVSDFRSIPSFITQRIGPLKAPIVLGSP